MISVNGVTKFYGDFKAVDDISFTVRDGEITGLLGPNGAGKTTTLRMLTSYLNSDAGSIKVGDFYADKSPLDIKKIVGYLPESAPIYGDMLVYDYLSYIAEIRGIENKSRIREIADLCALNEVMHKNVNELSKGYKQRVGLAHSMMHDPEILILDEPTSGLDPNQIIEIRNLIREIGKKKTVILSTHILSEVEATCDRVVIINRGRVVADDRTADIKSSVSGSSSVLVRVKGPSYEEFSAELGTLNSVTDVKEVPDEEFISARVKGNSDNDMRPEIFRLIAGKDWLMYEMRQESVSLENVFRELTTGGVNGQV